MLWKSSVIFFEKTKKFMSCVSGNAAHFEVVYPLFFFFFAWHWISFILKVLCTLLHFAHLCSFIWCFLNAFFFLLLYYFIRIKFIRIRWNIWKADTVFFNHTLEFFFYCPHIYHNYYVSFQMLMSPSLLKRWTVSRLGNLATKIWHLCNLYLYGIMT